MSENEFELETTRFLSDFPSELETLENLILNLTRNKSSMPDLTHILRFSHSLKGAAGGYGLHLIVTIVHRMEDSLHYLNITNPSIDELIDQLLHHKDYLEKTWIAYKEKDLDKLLKIRIELGLNESSSKSSKDALEINIKMPYRILLIEPSKVIVKSIINHLQTRQVEVASLKDGYEALGRLLNEPFDLIVTSGQIPTIDALRLLQILSIVPNPNRETQVIVLSSSKEKFIYSPFKNLIVLEKDPNLASNILSFLMHVPVKDTPIIPQGADRKLSILIVDDSQDIHRLIDIAFRNFPNVSINHLDDPTGTETIIQKIKPDLILLDVQMPQISGDQLFQKLKANHDLLLPAIAFLTGTENPDEIARLTALGPIALFKKPFSPKQLPKDIFALMQEKLVNAS